MSCDPLHTPAVENKASDTQVPKATHKPRKGGASPDHPGKLEHWHWRDGVIALVRSRPQVCVYFDGVREGGGAYVNQGEG